MVACTPRQTIVIVITATPTVMPTNTTIALLSNVVTPTVVARLPEASSYTVQSGDTLSQIALRYGTTVETLVALNTLPNPDILEVGQVINLPPSSTVRGSTELLLPDQLLVRGPRSSAWIVAAFIEQQTGYIRAVSEQIGSDLTYYTASEIVERVSLEFSVDARILLAALEFRAGWLTQPTADESQKAYPLIDTLASDGVDRRGLYRQLAWAANQLNWGFYSWKYYGNSFITFPTGERVSLDESLNAGTVGLQYLASRLSPFEEWETAIRGIWGTYTRLFGTISVPPSEFTSQMSVVQPSLELPFRSGDTWFYTGGHHGGWGRGSAWGAVDFAPPDERPNGSPLCYTSQFPITAVADGVIARSGDGTVILDLDNDGDEATGFTILYLHIASESRLAMGTTVRTGDAIGYASCEGGVSNATHMHIARRYNGEWIPNACAGCPAPRMSFPIFSMSGWSFTGLVDQEYQGYALREGIVISAEQGRLNTNNRIQRP